MDTNTQIERLVELAIIQRSELKRLVDELPQLKEHLSAEIERTFEETEPQLRAELEEWTSKQAADKTAALGVALESKIASLAKTLEETAQAKFSAILAARDQNANLLKQAEERIAVAASEIPGKVKEIVTAELARFPRAGEIDQLRKEFAEPRGLNPRGKWLPDQTYNKLDLVTWNGDSYVSNTDGNKERPGRNAANWTLSAARGTSGGGPADLSALTAVPSNGELLIGSGTSWVNGTLSAGAGISITVGPGAITISATDGDITLDDGTAASPSLHFTNDADTGIYRPAANTLGISVSGTQVAYFDENGLTVPSAGVVAGGSIHASNGNANNPSLSFSSDQDTGFFRHATNEIGIALGGTQYATWTSTTFSITPVVTMASSLRVNGTTDSTNKDTGAIVTEGGLGVEKSATIGGNLTVSGTGTVVGDLITNDVKPNAGYSIDWGNGTTITRIVADGHLQLNSQNGVYEFTGTGLTTFKGSLSVGTASGAAGQNAITFPKIGGGSYANAFYLYSGNTDAGNGFSLYDITASAWRWTTTNSGNFLIGTTTDGGQKLQVSGTAAATSFVVANSAGGGVVIGNSTGDYGSVGYNIAPTGTGGVYNYRQTDYASRIEFLQGGFKFKTAASGTAGNAITFTDALTIDSSQNAYGSSDNTYFSWDGNSNRIGITKQSGSVGKFTYGSASSFTISQSSGTTIQASNTFTDRFTIDSSGNATFTGSIAIGNTVNTVSPTSPNRTITMVIGGTTYYIHAKTTND